MAPDMDAKRLDEIINAVVRELVAAGVAQPAPAANSPTAGHLPAAAQPPAQAPQPTPTPGTPKIPPAVPAGPAALPIPPAGELAGLSIDLPDPTTPELRRRPGIDRPDDPEGLQALMHATPARIGLGRAGPRYRTGPWLLFQADAAVTQDTLWRDVDEALLAAQGLFKVQTCVSGGKQEYLLRPDLGRRLSEDAKRLIQENCARQPNIQVCVGDGLSAQAIEANLAQILPVIRQGCQAAGLSLGTPFFIQYCRVGVMNDIGDLLQPDVLMLLIGERPGLGRAESMSVYLGYRPQSGHTDAERDVICNIFNGGTNPLEAGAYAVQMAQKMIRYQAAGVQLKLAER